MSDQRPNGLKTRARRSTSGKPGLAIVGADAEVVEVSTSEPIMASGDHGESLETLDADIARDVEQAKARHPAGQRSTKQEVDVDTRPPTLAEEDEYYGLVYFGDPGKGKTSHAAALAKLGRIIFINSERGLKAGPIRRLGIPLENIEPRPSKEERDRGVEITYGWLEELAFEIKDRLLASEKIVGVVWDTGNDMYQRMLQTIVDVNGADRSNDWAAEIGDYGDVAQAMRRMIRRYHSLDCHWVVTFHAIRTKDQDGAIQVVPNLSDKLLVDMLGYVDSVIYCLAEDPDDTGEEEFTGFCRPTGKFQAKDRYKLLPKRMAVPTADRVIAYLSEELTAGTDPMQQAAKEKAIERASKPRA